ncbi:hypothetical protein GQ44DRAFT_180352 [Phaeosphaeriaceae sp. PMI808]|nr:hypothetical protein GQ44DRAFT_180352 [Phaeosphaeriaceae sp. PMI808]
MPPYPKDLPVKDTNVVRLQATNVFTKPYFLCQALRYQATRHDYRLSRYRQITPNSRKPRASTSAKFASRTTEECPVTVPEDHSWQLCCIRYRANYWNIMHVLSLFPTTYGLYLGYLVKAHPFILALILNALNFCGPITHILESGLLQMSAQASLGVA